MASFIVNGQEVSPSKNQKLLRFLRDELHYLCKDMVAAKALVEPVLLSLMDRLANPAYLTQIHWPERMSSQSRGFLIGNRKFTLMLTEGRRCTVRILYSWYGYVHKSTFGCKSNQPMMRFAMRCATTIACCTGYVKIMDAVRLATKILKEGFTR